MAHQGPSRPAATTLKRTMTPQHQNKGLLHLGDVRTAGRMRSYQLSSHWRWKMSPDAFTESYLLGHWPKEQEGQRSQYYKDKYTQTPESFPDKSQSRTGSSSPKRPPSQGVVKLLDEFSRLQLQQGSKPPISGGHSRDNHWGHPLGSCSWETSQPIPIPHKPPSALDLPPCSSVEGLNQELEDLLVNLPPFPHHRFFEVPDGRQAPVPLHNLCASESQSDQDSLPSQSSSSSFSSSSSSSSSSSTSSSSSSSSSPHCSSSPTSEGIYTYLPEFVDLPLDMQEELNIQPLYSPQKQSNLPICQLNSPSFHYNKNYSFHRDPPEGCEVVSAFEDSRTPQPEDTRLISFCPDPNRVNFTPHGASAFGRLRLL